MFDVTNKVVVVTGGGRGIGAGIAHTFAAQNAHVVIADLDVAACDEARKKLPNPDAHSCIALDVSNATAIDTAFDAVVAQFGRIDVLVNNAAVYVPQAADTLSEAEWDRTFAINVRGAFLCARKAARDMRARHDGRIISIASVSSGQIGNGLKGGAHYAASKAAVIALTESLALEWAEDGITVNAVAPGSIDTPMNRKYRLSEEEMKQFIKERIPLGRIGTPEEVAAAVVFLATDEARYITGTTVYVDGGWLAN